MSQMAFLLSLSVDSPELDDVFSPELRKKNVLLEEVFTPAVSSQYSQRSVDETPTHSFQEESNHSFPSRLTSPEVTEFSLTNPRNENKKRSSFSDFSQAITKILRSIKDDSVNYDNSFSSRLPITPVSRLKPTKENNKRISVSGISKAFQSHQSHVGSTSNVHDLESKVIELRAAAVAAKAEHQTNSASQMAALTEERDAVTAHLSIVQLENQELKSNILRLEWMLKECDSTLNGARQAHAGAVFRAEEAERQLADCLRCLSEEQQKYRFVLDERAELDVKLTKAEEKLVELTSLQITNSKLSMELERAQSWIQPTKKEREAELPEWKATEPRLQERISSLEASDNKKSRLLNGISQLIENKDRLLSDESANQLMQVPTAMVDDETKRARQFLQRYDDPRTFFTVGNRIPDNEYEFQAKDQLGQEFPRKKLKTITRLFNDNFKRYTPTFFALKKTAGKPYSNRKTRREKSKISITNNFLLEELEYVSVFKIIDELMLERAGPTTV